jgi:hypothetical protein
LKMASPVTLVIPYYVQILLTFLGAFASSWAVVQFIIWIKDTCALKRINKRNLPSLNNKAKRFLKTEFDIDWEFKLIGKKGAQDNFLDYGFPMKKVLR